MLSTAALRFILRAAVLLALSASLSAQASLLIDGEERVVLRAKDDSDPIRIRDLVAVAARYSDVEFTARPPSLLDQNLQISGESSVRRGRVFEWVRAHLVAADLTVTQIGKGRTRLYLIAARQDSTMIREKARHLRPDQLFDLRHEEGMLVAVHFPLAHLDADEARRALRSFATQRPSAVIEGGGPNSLLVIDFVPAVWRVHQLLQVFDRDLEEGTRRIGKLTLLNHDAPELAASLADLFSASPAASGVSMAEGRAPTRGRRRAAPRAPRVVGDMRTNSIVVMASAAEVAEILEVVALLDLEAADPSRTYKVHLLEYADAAALADELLAAFGAMTSGRRTRPLSDSEEPKDGRAEADSSNTGTRSSIRPMENPADGRTGSARGERAGTVDREEYPGQDPPRIVPVPDRNAIIVAASRRQHEIIDGLVKAIDIPRKPIRIDVFVAQINRDDLDSFGVELARVDQGGSLGYLLSTAFGLSSNTPTAAPGGFQRTPLLSQSGLLAGLISGSVGVPVLLQALEQSTKSRLLTTMSALCNEEETARVQTVQEVPTIERITSARRDGPVNIQDNGSGVNDPLIGLDDQSQIDRFAEYHGASMGLTVTPGRFTGEHVSIDLEFDLQEFTAPQADFRAPPPRAGSGLYTSVTITPGQLIFIGRLQQVIDGETVTGVPGLSSLPLVGEFLKRRDHTKSKRLLAVFMTARPLVP